MLEEESAQCQLIVGTQLGRILPNCNQERGEDRVHPSVCMAVSVNQSVCVPACLPVNQSVCVPACLPVSLSVCLSVSCLVGQSVSLTLSGNMTVLV